ncbi:alpha/beta hydrolase [Yoonia maricola]|nr:alpha/beta hydrolase [Yoonia maricola]
MELDDAYANAAYIPGADAYPDKWAQAAAAFRDTTLCELDLAYGEGPRQRYDLFHPQRLSKGLVVFVHGGYWLRFDKSFWSHLAAGPLAQGWSVAMPSYDLCPDVRITDIRREIMAAIAAMSLRVPGPIRLSGHSAGGQLVAMASVATPGARWQDRLVQTVAISPVADLAPLMRTSMNADLRLDEQQIVNESPVHQPVPKSPVTVWVGADERPVFLEQAEALAQAWQCAKVVDAGKHHFNVIEDLASPDSPLTAAVLG